MSLKSCYDLLMIRYNILFSGFVNKGKETMRFCNQFMKEGNLHTVYINGRIGIFHSTIEDPFIHGTIPHNLDVQECFPSTQFLHCITEYCYVSITVSKFMWCHYSQTKCIYLGSRTGNTWGCKFVTGKQLWHDTINGSSLGMHKALRGTRFNESWHKVPF